MGSDQVEWCVSFSYAHLECTATHARDLHTGASFGHRFDLECWAARQVDHVARVLEGKFGQEGNADMAVIVEVRYSPVRITALQQGLQIFKRLYAAHLLQRDHIRRKPADH